MAPDTVLECTDIEGRHACRMNRSLRWVCLPAGQSDQSGEGSRLQGQGQGRSGRAVSLCRAVNYHQSGRMQQLPRLGYEGCSRDQRVLAACSPCTAAIHRSCSAQAPAEAGMA